MVGLPETLTLATFKARDGPARKREVFVAPGAGYAARHDRRREAHPTRKPDARGRGRPEAGPAATTTTPRRNPATGGHTIPIEDEQPDPQPEGEDELQEENAETSLDQPSQ